MVTRVTRRAAAAEAVKDAASKATALTPAAKDPSPQQLSSPPGTSAPKRKPAPTEKATTKKDEGETPIQTNPTRGRATTVKKRKRVAAPKVEEDPNELPHNLGKAFVAGDVGVKGEVGEDIEPSPKKRSTKKASEQEHQAKDAVQTMDKAASTDSPSKSPRKKSAKTKDNPYGLTPGVTPYPDWPHPTPEECYEVNDILTKLHGKQGAPPKIPPPSLTITGCGEVPSILDALIRTLLSGNTTGLNSGRAMKGLVAKFGTLQDGIGKGSLDYDGIRKADLEEVIDAIKEGGMQKKKGMYIKKLLDIVYEENKARRDTLVTAKEADESAAPRGAENETSEQKEAEITRADDHVLSLDYIHHLEKDEAITTMTKYPQIGVKTAACVVLFCMRIPCFAVDTHVFRLSKWLGWIPPNVGADPITTFRHLEVMIPDELKYSLHQLFIKHGKACPRCRAITGPNSEGWDEGCIIDHLVKRTGPMKQGLPRAKGSKGKKGKKTDDSEAEESEEPLSDDDFDAEEEKEEDVGKKVKGKGSTGKKVKGKTKVGPVKVVKITKEKPKGKAKAKGKGKNGKKLVEEDVSEQEAMDDEDAAMEDVANDVLADLPKAKGKTGPAKVPAGKAKASPANGVNTKANTKSKAKASRKV